MRIFLKRLLNIFFFIFISYEINAACPHCYTLAKVKLIMEDNKEKKVQMDNRNVGCHLRVIIDSKMKASIHDRWIMSMNKCYNVPSIDVVARGQYSEIKETLNRPPFEEWWGQSEDILTGWESIKKCKIIHK